MHSSPLYQQLASQLRPPGRAAAALLHSAHTGEDLPHPFTPRGASHDAKPFYSTAFSWLDAHGFVRKDSRGRAIWNAKGLAYVAQIKAAGLPFHADMTALPPYKEPRPKNTASAFVRRPRSGKARPARKAVLDKRALARSPLHTRAAHVLHWSVKDAQSMSLYALAAAVRPKDPALSDEIRASAASGAWIDSDEAHASTSHLIPKVRPFGTGKKTKALVRPTARRVLSRKPPMTRRKTTTKRVRVTKSANTVTVKISVPHAKKSHAKKSHAKKSHAKKSHAKKSHAKKRNAHGRFTK